MQISHIGHLYIRRQQREQKRNNLFKVPPTTTTQWPGPKIWVVNERVVTDRPSVVGLMVRPSRAQSVQAHQYPLAVVSRALQGARARSGPAG